MLKHTIFFVLAAFIFANSPVTLAEDAESYQLESINNGDYSKAESELLRVLESKPNDPFALLNLAFIYQKYGENDKARAVYDRIMAQKNNPHAELASGKPQRVKSIAAKGLALIDND